MPNPITTVIIPVAGLGTRFLPATKAQPKEMLPLVDKPVIQYVVEEAEAAGMTSVCFVTGRGKAAIENHFDVASELEQLLATKGKLGELLEVQRLNRLLKYAYVRQGAPLGLGHALLCARGFAAHGPVAAILGDEVFTGPGPALQPLLEAHAQTGLTVVGVQQVAVEELGRYGVVNAPPASGSGTFWPVDQIIEKPEPHQAPSRFAIVGRYILTPEVFEILETIPPGFGGEYQLTDALAVLAQRGRLRAALIPHRRFDTGNKLGYLKACIDFTLARPEFAKELADHMLAQASAFFAETKAESLSKALQTDHN